MGTKAISPGGALRTPIERAQVESDPSAIRRVPGWDRNEPVVSLELASLSALHLERLIHGETAAIRIANFYRDAALPGVVERILASPLLARYANAPDIGKIGNSYFETVCGLRKDDYFASARSLKHELDELFRPLTNPADLMKNVLAGTWEPGASVLQNDAGQTFFYGLIRLFDGTEALAHVDHLEWDDVSAARPIFQLALNTYLRIPADGGELVVWDTVPTREEHDLIAKDYGVDEAYLRPFRSVAVKPNEGDLIMFDAQRVHAVRTAHGPRITSSMFAVLLDAAGAFRVYS